MVRNVILNGERREGSSEVLFGRTLKKFLRSKILKKACYRGGRDFALLYDRRLYGRFEDGIKFCFRDGVPGVRVLFGEA